LLAKGGSRCGGRSCRCWRSGQASSARRLVTFEPSRKWQVSAALPRELGMWERVGALLRLLTPQSRGWLCSCGRVALRLCASCGMAVRAVERTCCGRSVVDALVGIFHRDSSHPRLFPPRTLSTATHRSPTGNSAGDVREPCQKFGLDELLADGPSDGPSAVAVVDDRAAVGTSGGTSAGTAAAAASDDSRSVAPFRVGTDCSGVGLHGRLSINGWMRKRLLLNGLSMLLCLVAQLVSEWPVLRQEPLQTSTRTVPLSSGSYRALKCVATR
jgi:hypothetical protein